MKLTGILIQLGIEKKSMVQLLKCGMIYYLFSILCIDPSCSEAETLRRKDER